jgi:hypothetical protein
MRRADVEERHVLRHEGMWVASPEATAVELAGGRDLDEAVVAVDPATGSTGSRRPAGEWCSRPPPRCTAPTSSSPGLLQR